MRRLLPFTLFIFCYVLGHGYEVRIEGKVHDPQGNSVANLDVRISTSPNSVFTYSNVVTTNAQGEFVDSIEVPDDASHGVVLVALENCHSTQVKRVVFNPNKT